MSAHEDYLQGKPLNDELASLRDQMAESMLKSPGVMPSLPFFLDGAQNPLRELNTGEREDLKELRNSVGWPVLNRVLEKAFQNHKNRAIALSQQDPLRHRDAIAEEWAYCTMFNRARIEMETLVKQEIEQLEPVKQQ
jgi:hypothetical protein